RAAVRRVRAEAGADPHGDADRQRGRRRGRRDAGGDHRGRDRSAPRVKSARRLLRPAAWVYGAAMRVRNRRYDSGRATVHRLEVPVVCVGNLTVGGAGKTPLVLWLAETALA